MRRSPLALVLSLAILASLGVATAAFAMKDKTVNVDVDGHLTAVHTFAGDVSGVLRRAGITVGAHDTVAPDLTAPVHDGSRVFVRHGRLLHLEVDGKPRAVWVTALSVNEALDDLGLADRGAWLSASRSLSIPRSGLALRVRLPQRVSVLVDGKRLTRHTTAPSVRLLLHDLHVRLHRLDHVSVPLRRYPTNGLVVSVARITQRKVTRDVAIPFRTKHVKDASLYVGHSKVRRYGRPGLRVNTFKLTWRNHKLVHRHLVRSKVHRHPSPQVIAVGTKPVPQDTPRADGLNWSALASCESGGNPRDVSANGEYRGLYQFTLGAWHGVGGAGDPINASSSEQTYRAQLLYRRSGDAAWPTCGHYLYT